MLMSQDNVHNAELHRALHDVMQCAKRSSSVPKNLMLGENPYRTGESVTPSFSTFAKPMNPCMLVSPNFRRNPSHQCKRTSKLEPPVLGVLHHAECSTKPNSEPNNLLRRLRRTNIGWEMLRQLRHQYAAGARVQQ